MKICRRCPPQLALPMVPLGSSILTSCFEDVSRLATLDQRRSSISVKTYTRDTETNTFWSSLDLFDTPFLRRSVRTPPFRSHGRSLLTCHLQASNVLETRSTPDHPPRPTIVMDMGRIWKKEACLTEILRIRGRSRTRNRRVGGMNT